MVLCNNSNIAGVRDREPAEGEVHCVRRVQRGRRDHPDQLLPDNHQQTRQQP